MESVITANGYHLVVQVFSQDALEVSTSVGLIISFWIMSKHFKMYIKVNDMIGEKTIYLAYPIQGKEVTVVSMFSQNIQYNSRKIGR